MLGFTTLIYKMGLLTGGISIVVDRNSLFNRSTQPTESSAYPWVSGVCTASKVERLERFLRIVDEGMPGV